MPLGSMSGSGTTGLGGSTGYTSGVYAASGINIGYNDDSGTTGKAIYALLIDENRRLWNPSTEEMTDFTSVADHAITLAQTGDLALNWYYANVHPTTTPALATGNYTIQIWEGNNYSKGLDELKTQTTTYYNVDLDREVTTAELVDILVGTLQTFDDPNTGENANQGRVPANLEEVLILVKKIASKVRAS